MTTTECKPGTTDWERDITAGAVHEAGHFVVGAALGLPIEKATIRRSAWNGDLTGATHLARGIEHTRDTIRADAACTVAGALAQERWLREHGCPPAEILRITTRHGAADQHILRRLLRTGHTTEREANALAHRILDRRWTHVVDRGHALAHRGTLRGKEPPMNAVARDIEYAANHIRTANHSTMRGALTVPETYDAVGNLAELVQRLPQVLDYLSRSVHRADPAEHFDDRGRDPSEALTLAHGQLDDVHAAISNAAHHLTTAHNHLGHLGRHTTEN